MPARSSRRLSSWWLAASLMIPVAGEAAVQSSSSNPYRLVDNWAQLPGGREMGAVGKVTIDPDGQHIWAIVRCDAGGDRFGSECLDSDLDPVIKFDLEGNAVESFGGGMFIWPHGIDVGPDGSVWVTDAVSSATIPAGDTRGHQVVKFSPTGEVLLTLGMGGMEGPGTAHFTSPSDVAVAENGDVFVADGHGNEGNNRVVKFTSNGEYILEWGGTGYGPGQFRTLHAIDIDPSGRVFVGDRSNSRIQIFDQEGTHISTWTQFGRPSGIFIDADGTIYVADSESDDVQNPGWEMGIRIGEVETGWVSMFIPYQWGDPRETAGNGAEFVAVDRQGNLYGGEPRPRKLQKYIRVRP
jgi:DNA-binding beta-propeller fold protein YncE